MTQCVHARIRLASARKTAYSRSHERSLSSLRARARRIEARPLQADPVPADRAECRHPAGALPRADGDAPRRRGQARDRDHLHPDRGGARRRRRASRAPAQGHLALRGRARFALGFRQFRRRDRLCAVDLRAARSALVRLDHRADAGLRHGAEARALQRHDRRSGPAGMAEELLRRHAGAGRRDHRDAAALSAASSACRCRNMARPSSGSTSCSSPS